MGIFEGLRGDSAERSERVAGLAFAAGVAASLAVGGDELRELDLVDGLVWLFVTGVSLGFAVYWLAGWALGFVVPRLGGEGPARRARHVLGYSFAPLVLALPLWAVWSPLLALPAIGTLLLLLGGLREVYGWGYGRAVAAVALAAVWLGALAVALLSVLVLLGRLGE